MRFGRQRHTREQRRSFARGALAGHGSFGFESAFILLCDTYGDAFDDIAPVLAGSSVSSLVEDDEIGCYALFRFR